RLAKEGGPALRRLMESADQIGVVLEVVGDMRNAVSDMSPFVLTRHPEDRGRDGIGRDLLQVLEQFHERALPQDVEEEGRVREVVLGEQALQGPLRGGRDILQTAAV